VLFALRMISKCINTKCGVMIIKADGRCNDHLALND
jgi:hypothetical protein